MTSRIFGLRQNYAFRDKFSDSGDERKKIGRTSSLLAPIRNSLEARVVSLYRRLVNNSRVTVTVLLSLWAVISVRTVVRSSSSRSKSSSNNDPITVPARSLHNNASSAVASTQTFAPVPRKLFIGYEHDLLQKKEPGFLSENVRNTFSKYSQVWQREDHSRKKKPSVREGGRTRERKKSAVGGDKETKEAKEEIKFLTDHDCGIYVARANTELVPHYYSEKDEAIRSQICILAALYLEGGYYFDAFVQVVDPFVLNNTVSFAGVTKKYSATQDGMMEATDDAQAMTASLDQWDDLEFLPLFLASSPKHPLLQVTLDSVLEYYHSSEGDWIFAATGTGFAALTDRYLSVRAETPGSGTENDILSSVALLDQDNLRPDPSQPGFSDSAILYPNLERKNKILRGSNNYRLCHEIIHDRVLKKPYFYTRIVGSPLCPFPTKLPKLNLEYLKGAKTTNGGKIPQILWFTYKYDLLERNEPKSMADNVRKTIALYREQGFHDANAPAIMLDDDKCASLISEVEPDLVPYFYKEGEGAYRSDICRVAALYIYGGYYFDVDMEVVEPYILENPKTFVTVLNPEETVFFQSFLAASPGNGVLRKALDLMLQHYRGEYWRQGWFLLGPQTLFDAFNLHYFSTNPIEAAGATRANALGMYKKEGTDPQIESFFLKEAPLKPDMYPSLKRRGKGALCNHIVHDQNRQKVHFMSRIIGSSHCPE